MGREGFKGWWRPAGRHWTSREEASLGTAHTVGDSDQLSATFPVNTSLKLLRLGIWRDRSTEVRNVQVVTPRKRNSISRLLSFLITKVPLLYSTNVFRTSALKQGVGIYGRRD